MTRCAAVRSQSASQFTISGFAIILLVITIACVAAGADGGVAHVNTTSNLAADAVGRISSVDLRAAFTNWGLPLRAQGKRGTCSVFAMTGALEYALARERQQGAALSVEFLNWASNAAVSNSQDGGFFSDLWAGFAKYGVCAEADMPYQRRYEAQLQPSALALEHAKLFGKGEPQLHWIKPWDVHTGLSRTQLLEIKRVLAKRWPVAGGLRWPKKERWQNRVLEMAPASDVFDGHSVLLVGYRDDSSEPGGGVFLIRNSGGGLHDAEMSYEYASAYMNDAVWIDYTTETR